MHFLLPLAAFAISYPRPGDWSAHNVFNIILFGEAGMLCVWAGLGDRPWWQRLIGTLAGLTVCWILLWLRETRQTPEMLVRCLLFPGAASLILAIAIKSTTASVVDGPDAKSVWQVTQFTMGQLLIFTSTVAVVIVLVQHSLKGNIVINPRLVLAEGAQISIVLLVLAALRGRWRRSRILLASLVACAVGLVVQSFMSDSYFWDVLHALKNFAGVPPAQLWEDLLSIPATIMLEGLLAAATVVTTRSAAYRPSTS